MNKRLLLSVIPCLLLNIGCTNKTGDSTQTTIDSSTNVWHVSLNIDATSLKNLAPFSQKTIRDGEKEVALTYNQTGYLNESVGNSYTDNAIIVQNDDVQCVYDYDGNLLYTLTTTVSNTYNEEGISVGYAYTSNETNYLTQVFGTSDDNKAVVLNGDFCSVTEISTDSFIYHPYDGNQVFDDIVIQNGKVGILSHTKSSEGEDQSGYEFQEYTKTSLPDMYLAKNVNSNCEVKETVVVDKDGNVLSVVPEELYTKESGQFVNGYYPVYQKDDEEKKIAMIHASDGNAITDYKYYDVGYFEDGYCPVKNSEGKWAYINEKGEEVTDFIFDEASSLYKGKAWVIKDNKAGVLNLSVSEKGKLTESIFSDTSSDDPVSPSPTSSSDDSSSESKGIGTLKVKVSSLNIRKGAGTSYDTNGTATDGETYEVLETKEADGYTWYRIGEDKWVAGNDEWVTYTKK